MNFSIIITEFLNLIAVLKTWFLGAKLTRKDKIIKENNIKR